MVRLKLIAIIALVKFPYKVTYKVLLWEKLGTVKALPALNPLPAGVVEESAGDAEIMQEIFGRFGGALALAVMCIYAILVLLYNNFLHPLTIMAALPFCLGGALLGLFGRPKIFRTLCPNWNCLINGHCD